MTATTTISLTRPAEYLLVRLLAPTRRPVPPSRLREELSRLLREPFGADCWQALLEELSAAGLVTVRPLRLTQSGQANARALLGIQHLPQRATWRMLRDRYLVPRTLGIVEEANETRSRRKPWDDLGVSLLRRHYDLKLADNSRHTLNAALEALACKELGFPNETNLTAVRDSVLYRLLDLPQPPRRKELPKQIVQKVVGARRAGLPAVREAVLCDWLSPSASPEVEVFDLPVFAATVEAAARTSPAGRFGDNKVFISHVWKQLQTETHLPVHSLVEFKQRLTEANRAGLLRLSRADLVQAMNPDDVQQSETRYLDAVFHFIHLEGGRP